MVEHLNSLQANISMIKTELQDIKLHETKEQLNSLQVKLEDERHRHTQSITELHQQINITQTVLSSKSAELLSSTEQLNMAY